LRSVKNHDIFSNTKPSSNFPVDQSTNLPVDHGADTIAMDDTTNRRLIFIHGLISSGQSFKANLLRGLFPNIFTPDFEGTLDERMAQLATILSNKPGWIIIGSSFGGLMGALFTCHHPKQVQKLILLAPALIWPEFAQALPAPVSVPAVVYHGQRDDLIPLDLVRSLAEQVFTNLNFHAVDDDHGLHDTVQTIDWMALLDKE
jgi:pimeloyl-ACP methyl ester carboxylesterase